MQNYFPKIYFVSVQNGIRTKYFFQKLTKEKNLKCDYILTWGSKIAAEYRKHIECKTLPIGSFNNNRHNIKKRKKKRKSIVLIASKYRRKGETVYISRPNFFLSREVFFKTEKAILPKIFAICKKLNRNFEIVSKTVGKKVYEEKKFYEDILQSKNFKLHIKGKSKNIYDILNMTIEEAHSFFQQHKPISRKLATLCKVGLGYLKLGQQATTLSGGESQRIKLSSELSKVSTGRTLYILDEPTTGLHFQDVQMLISVLNSLVDKGNTVIVIEHNLDVIKCSDWIIDLGPEGGASGGQIIATGPPEELIKNQHSYTGQFLKQQLK